LRHHGALWDARVRLFHNTACKGRKHLRSQPNDGVTFQCIPAAAGADRACPFSPAGRCGVQATPIALALPSRRLGLEGAAIAVLGA
jgi:hypothetical protein